MQTLTLEQLRTYAVARSLFTPTTLLKAITKLGFVQADPIRAPARAQGLTLSHRVRGYRAGDLEARYAQLPIEEDFFVNYGFLPRTMQQLMHPRTARSDWSTARWQQAQTVLEFVRSRGVVHPSEVDAEFRYGKSKNWFGGSSNASTQLLDGMHYRGLLRVAGRKSGVRTYAACELPVPVTDVAAAMDRLVDLIVATYAPLPQGSLSQLVMRLRTAVPQWTTDCRAAFARALLRLPSVELAGHRWFWPAGENPGSRQHALDEEVRLLAPFDPIVWDRRRFELFWGWAYRFEAYTPVHKRVRGYYALPLLWRGHVIGWATVAVRAGQLDVQLGYVSGRPPQESAFTHALDGEVERMARFLALD